MKLGLVTYNLARRWDVPTIIKNCSETGFAGVELRTTHAHGVEDTLDAAGRAEVRARFADSPVQIVGLGSVLEYHSLDPAEVRRNVEGARSYVKLAHDVGAPGVKVRPNGLQEAAGIPRAQTLEQIGRALRECGQFAADYGVEVRLEMHGGVQEAADIRRIMEVADCPAVKVCWNSNAPDVKDGSIIASFGLVSEWIALVHINELWSPAYPYPELFARLARSDYQGFCCAEIQESADPIRLMRYYRALYLALQP